MYTFTHEYLDNEIKFTVDMLGREKLFVNGELVSQSKKWSMKSTHTFMVADQELKLEVKVRSLMSGEYEVNIFENEQGIFSQTQVLDVAADGHVTSFDEDERRWKKEIEFPEDILNLAWLFYFIMISASIVSSFTDSTMVSDSFAFVVVLTLCYALYKMIKSAYEGLKTI